MIATPEILARLRAEGAVVRLEGGHLHLEAPTGPPRSELLQALRANRDAVIAHLARPVTYGCSQCGRHLFPEPGFVCYWCRRRADGAPQWPACGCGEA